MSGFLEFVTTPEFLTGSFVSGLLGAGIGYVSTRSSDKRKFTHEEKMQTRKEDREDKLRDQQNLHTAGMEFVEVCSDILMTTIDIKGLWNIMRDWFYDQTGEDDPMAERKFGHSEKVMAAQMRIAVPVNKLKLVAPTEVLDAATRTTAAIMMTVQQTTEPFAGRVAHKTASDELNKFISVFREAAGRDPYTDAETQAQVYAFMETLKQQVADFIEEAKADMKAAGFTSTPWDQPSADGGSSTPGGSRRARFSSVEPGGVPVTTIQAGDLTEDHVGKFMGCHDPAGFNYGAEILKVVRVEEGSRPGMLVRIQHPPIPGRKQARQERMLLRFDHEVELVDLPGRNSNGSAA
ncbi:hypothetical protein QRB36_06320 [Mycobacterium marseillense]|uniref:hypothetical protein n=1 Tax=Mycobacterium marseillense TaxID=701042 RepID=UPI002596B53C|nr:hypothetical protein [Mycobacterium marseillense]MDM3973778.1 hypothetical protein [Mycobacterium marseillense]